MAAIPLQSIFLLVEAAALAALAFSLGMPWLLPAAGIAALLGSLQTPRLVWPGLTAATAISLTWFLTNSPSSPFPSVAAAVIALVLGTACAFLGIISSLGKTTTNPVAPLLGKLAVILHFISAGVFLAAPHLSFPVTSIHGWTITTLLALLSADTFLKLVSRLYTPRRHWDDLARPGAFFFFRWLGREWRACLPSSRQPGDDFHLNLSEMWMWPLLRRSMPALLAAIALLAWLTTSVHEIPAGSQGVRQTTGTWQDKPLPPGFHLSLPWPLGKIHSVDTALIREIVLGFRADPGKPILWERAHYEDEQMSLVGGGDDLLSISVPVLYRIADPAAFLRGAADPDKLVRDTGSRVLLELTLSRPASEIMTSGREDIRIAFHQRLQSDLDHAASGILIEAICPRDIHPPVEVAPSFQEVLSAMEEKEAMIHDGESYRREYSARASGEAATLVTTAESSAANRLAKVDGEMTRFISRRDAWSQSPRLFEIREGFRQFDETLAETKKTIVDERIRSTLNTQLDLRRVLNPDLVDHAPPVPQTLVPRPSRSRDAFDLDIEGFLRMDQGEVPAVSSASDDPDNLFKSNVPAK